MIIATGTKLRQFGAILGENLGKGAVIGLKSVKFGNLPHFDHFSFVVLFMKQTYHVHISLVPWLCNHCL